MKTDGFMQKLVHGIASCLLVALPTTGWSAEISDRPLFIEANLDHNLMFVVDDSGSMDYEVLIPKQSGMNESWSDGYLFDPGTEGGTYSSYYRTGKIIYGTNSRYHIVYSMNRNRYFFYSPDYNLQYYDPEVQYTPWAAASSRTFGNQSIDNAQLDPGFGSSSVTADLTETNELGVGSDNVPATAFLKSNSGTVEKILPAQEVYDDCPSGWEVYRWNNSLCRRGSFWSGYDYMDRPTITIPATVQDTVTCSNPDENWFSGWSSSPGDYRYKDESGDTLAAREWGLGPDGACILRLELVEGNESRVQDLTGSTLAEQQTNFANWFSYYRRRHQAIRSGVAQSVAGLDNLRLGVFGLNSNTRFAMDNRMYSANDASGTPSFLDDLYSLFDAGNYYGQGTPNRLALQHAGQQYAKTNVRGDLECRKNFTLLFTDGYSNNHNPNSIDADNADGSAGAPYANAGASDTLGDIAYYYYQGLRDANGIISGGDTPIPSECGTGSEKDWMDCNKEYHMNTYTVGLGMTGQDYAGITHFKVKDAYDDSPDWSTVSDLDSAGNSAQIDDLYHAAVNGKGEYFDARSTAELVLALENAVDLMQADVGSGSGINFNTSSLSEGGAVFSAAFTSVEWTGDLRAENVDEDGDIGAQIWSAKEKLDERDLAADPRLVLTYGMENGNQAGTTFEWDNLTDAQKSDLKVAADSDAEGLAKKRIDFLLGDAVESYGGVDFRDRKSRMGAIVNSSPQYVGIPGKNWPNTDPFGASGDRYSAFRDAKENRDAVVYVGANDGMLHGFDAETGREVLAYIPSFLASDTAGEGLHALTQTSFDYQSYVDLPVAVSDIYINDDWKTVLIGGARANGPGLFALDVTEPSTFSAANADDIVMWEFTPEDDANMGHQIAEVQITMLDWGGGDFRWSAVFENGYGASTGRNGLFVLDLGKGQGAAWSEGTNYKFIDLGAGDGLSPVRLVDHVDANGVPGSDGMADRAYAGDLEGRIWAIDLTGGSTAWSSDYSTNPLFTATDSSGVVQPITVRPIVARNSYEPGLPYPNLIVLFGTGEYLNYADLANEQRQSFYGINDRGASNLSRAAGSLMERDLTETSHPDSTVTSVVRKTDNEELDWTTKFGWFVDFDERDGERVVSHPSVEGDYVVFPTNIPVADDPCGGGGASFIMALQIDGSTDPSDGILDVNNDEQLDGIDAGWSGVYFGDTLINSTTRVDEWLFGAGADGSKEKILTDFGSNNMGARRASWREVIPE